MSKQIAPSIILLIVFLAVVASAIFFEKQEVSASSAVNCDLVNSTGQIDIYYCIDSYTDFSYYINSYGFMMEKPE